jgi:hypothetical protein
MSLGGGFFPPDFGLGIILFYSPPLGIHDPEFVLRPGITLDGFDSGLFETLRESACGQDNET